MAHYLCGIEIKRMKIDRIVDENAKRLHNHIWKYALDRKNGVTKSQMNGVDLLSVHLENKEVFFSDKHVVGGILGALAAGIETSQYAMQTVVTNLIKNKSHVEKLRKEFDEQVR